MEVAIPYGKQVVEQATAVCWRTRAILALRVPTPATVAPDATEPSAWSAAGEPGSRHLGHE